MKRAALVAAILLISASAASAAVLEIVHIDVGQGDSTLIRGPNGTAVLIDGGGGACNTGHPKDNIYAVLDAYGITQEHPLDYILLTHYDQDHLAYLDDVIEDHGCPNEAIYDRGGTHKWSGDDRTEIPASYLDACDECPGRREILDLWAFNETDSWNFANHRGIDLGDGAKLVCVAAGYPVYDSTTDDELYTKIIWDDADGQEDIYIGRDENAKSIALLLTYGGYQELLGGDLNETVEPDLGLTLTDPGLDLPSIDVYKVHHHGSSSSSTQDFLAAIAAEVSVCSVGAHGTYNHPRRDAYQRLHEAGSFIYQTCEGEEDPESYVAPPEGWGVLVNGPVTIIATTGRYDVSRNAGGDLDRYPIDDEAWRIRILRPRTRMAP
jgi:beta-lactamase superfamily II metal-dependent hydrolase